MDKIFGKIDSIMMFVDEQTKQYKTQMMER